MTIRLTDAWKRRLSIAGGGVGILLLIAAIAAAVAQRDVLETALGALRDADPAHIATLLAAIVCNIVLSGLLFSALIARYGRVGIGEMQALIAAATLVNFLPLRPGMFGRVAYHRAVNGIRAADTARTIVQALVLSSVLAGFLVVAVLAGRYAGIPLWSAVLAPAVAAGALSLHSATRRWTLPALLRWVDLLAWAVRYHAAFALIGAPVGWETAVGLACVSVIAMLVPFVSNGLGIREWAVGLLAPYLAGTSLEVGLTAELVNRAAEIVVIVVAGGVSAVWLVPRVTGRSRDPRP